MEDGMGQESPAPFEEDEKVHIPYGHDRVGDDVKLAPINDPGSIFNGRICAYAVQGGVPVCWNCFEPLEEKGKMVAMVGDALIYICSDKDCRVSISRVNSKRDGDVGAGKLFSVPGGKS